MTKSAATFHRYGSRPPTRSAQSGVEHLVGQDEAPLLVAVDGERVDVDLAEGRVDRRDPDLLRPGQVEVGHDRHAGRDRPE
jgi:hypothetical protein